MAHPFLFGAWENIYFIYIYVYVNTYFRSISYASFFLPLKITQPLCWQFSLDLRSLNGDIKDVVCFAKLHIFFLLSSSSVWGFKPCLCFRCLVWRVSSSGERLRGDSAPEHCYWWDSLTFRNFCLLWAHSDFLHITEKLSPQTETKAHGLMCLAPLPSPGALTCFFLPGCDSFNLFLSTYPWKATTGSRWHLRAIFHPYNFFLYHFSHICLDLHSLWLLSLLYFGAHLLPQNNTSVSERSLNVLSEDGGIHKSLIAGCTVLSPASI